MNLWTDPIESSTMDVFAHITSEMQAYAGAAMDTVLGLA